MTVTIHQPEYLPWLGFFDKIRQADVWVVLDHVQYRKNYFQNRNRVRGDRGAVWLTVPVLSKGRFGQALNEVAVDNDGSPRWRAKCWKSLVQCYEQAPFFSPHHRFFETLYDANWSSLVELNEAIIGYLLSALGIEVRTVRSSALEARGAGSELLLRICRELGADGYLSGISGREYLDVGLFQAEGIEVRFQDFHHPVYRQLHQPFIPCLSAVDLLFTCGPSSLDIIGGDGVERLQYVFE